MKKKLGSGLLVVLIFTLTFHVVAIGQDPLRFADEIEAFSKRTVPIGDQPLVIFTGSSSIRGWTGIEKYFPGYRILNHGFGGSQMSDLLYFLNECLLKYQPDQVFIYEGDNDLSSGKTSKEIVGTAKKIIEGIHNTLPSTRIAFISPKPSPARWHLKSAFLELNEQLEMLSKENQLVDFIDIWTKMMGPDGTVMKDIFKEDELHMNEKGYHIWALTIKPFLID
jgi:lysophospholipase L1-like esterase